MTAVFGIDAHNAAAFLENGFICLDKTTPQEERAVSAFHTIRTEDVIFIKSFDAQAGLRIKAAGVALSDHTIEAGAVMCIPVNWVWQGEKLIEEFDEKCSHCGDPFYEENNITVQKEIIDLMPGKLQLPDEW